ncbi:putative alpha-l-rhamnosidase protein [Phaeoacremonium minimum UCRPA7]|uniref:alpha-L-rhamnosidase n=1 Tax=Phaeoacremonium minimum (strain UCR-PA7) TaxID=1286976 RepID=R8B9Q3_PHAM7|nr:putative alpha-l-rhamnosidase protein [Phaeoacremonium minimum UCRPA7]EON96012.1 putative alpha-l-rhamnosidase protein [Phaeoacremonium minimum UCRPA7]
MWYSVILLAALFVFTRGINSSAVKVVRLSVDGRTDVALGLGNPRPTLAWQMIQVRDCDEPVCPGDRQSAYRVQAATTLEDLRSGRLVWDSGKVDSNSQQVRFGRDLNSRDTVVWHVRVWDANGTPSGWSPPSTWTTGLLNQSDWGEARWINHPTRTETQPLPLFVRHFNISQSKKVAYARFYLSGVGMHHATVNGEDVTDEVLAPGYSNYQLSSEYRTYDVKKALKPGANSIGVSLGNGPAYIRRSVTNAAVGRNAPYAWWESQLKGNGTLITNAEAGSTTVHLNNVTRYHLGGTINIDTGDGGEALESRTITVIDNSTNTISFTPGLTLAHKSGVIITGSGNNIAASDPSAGAAVTPRLIGRLEIVYTDGSTDVIVTDRSWRTTLGPLVTNQWYSGSDYDARREQADWDSPGVYLALTTWIAAGFAPPPNLATKLVARAAEPVKMQETFKAISVTNPVASTWVFEFAQNFAGWPLLKLPELPPGVTIKMAPAESLNANGTVDQSSLGPGSRGTDLFNTYTTSGRPGGETWSPKFNYFGMQWVQVTGLPAGFKPDADLITGIRLQVDAPVASTFSSSNARVNRVHKMAWYSFASNMMSVFTDCPGREKLSYPADYTMPMGAIYRNFNINAFLRTIIHHLVEAQSIADTPMAGNVALKAPVYDWGYSGRFGDEINWGDAIVLVPSLLHDLYRDTTVMAAYYNQMTDFVDYIQREKAQGHIVDAALADWVDDNGETSGRITGTWGYYLTISAMARMANLTSHAADAERYASLAAEIRDAFHAAFYNDASGRYTNSGNNSTSNATQAAQALALDAGLVPGEHRESVLNALVELVNDYHSSNSSGPHFSGGTIGLGPIVRALSAGNRDDLLWSALQQDDKPSYGYFMASTVANPNGFTTIGESWDRGSSKNHMILAQIDEWFHAGIAGIRPNSLTTLSQTWEDQLVFHPKPVGDLENAAASYQTQHGEARSEWRITTDGAFTLSVTVPANTNAEVRVPGQNAVKVSPRAKRAGTGQGYTIYTVPSGMHTFNTTILE